MFKRSEMIYNFTYSWRKKKTSRAARKNYPVRFRRAARGKKMPNPKTENGWQKKVGAGGVRAGAKRKSAKNPDTEWAYCLTTLNISIFIKQAATLRERAFRSPARCHIEASHLHSIVDTEAGGAVRTTGRRPEGGSGRSRIRIKCSRALECALRDSRPNCLPPTPLNTPLSPLSWCRFWFRSPPECEIDRVEMSDFKDYSFVNYNPSLRCESTANYRSTTAASARRATNVGQRFKYPAAAFMSGDEIN